MKYLLLLSIFTFTNMICAQENKMEVAPYHQIPDYPDDYGPGNVLSRMIDGLGYRFYWASYELTEMDLTYKPSEDGKSTLETMDHMYGLSSSILNSSLNKANVRPLEQKEMSFEELRLEILKNLMAASEACRNKTKEELAETKVVFQRGENKNEFELWHMMNGFIADALYHTGQIVAFRRASGNPMPTGVNVFMGKTKE